MPLSVLCIAAALVALSGFFSLSFEALSLARKSRFRMKNQDDVPAGDKPPGAAEKQGMFVFGLRIWNLTVRVAAAALVACYSGSSAPVHLVVLLLAFIVFSEFLPGVIAAAGTEGILRVVFPVLSVICLPWEPLYTLASRLHPSRSAEDAGEEEFRRALDEGEKSGAVESRERSMVEGVMYLGDRPVSAFMIHRSETECLDINAGPDEARQKALEFRSQGFFPVVRETQDDIAGVVSVEDIFIALAGTGGQTPGWKGLAALMKPPYCIPETMTALKAFESFRREEAQYLCVMDEYGGFAGGLRVRNLLEEIVGEFPGAAPEQEDIVREEDGSWFVRGSVSVDDLAGLLGQESLDSGGGYHTLAGFILKLAGDIPRAGDSFTWQGWRFTVAVLDGNRIEKVRIGRIEV
jgi:putative hemolysin